MSDTKKKRMSESLEAVKLLTSYGFRNFLPYGFYRVGVNENDKYLRDSESNVICKLSGIEFSIDFVDLWVCPLELRSPTYEWILFFAALIDNDKTEYNAFAPDPEPTRGNIAPGAPGGSLIKGEFPHEKWADRLGRLKYVTRFELVRERVSRKKNQELEPWNVTCASFTLYPVFMSSDGDPLAGDRVHVLNKSKTLKLLSNRITEHVRKMNKVGGDLELFELLRTALDLGGVDTGNKVNVSDLFYNPQERNRIRRDRRGW